MKNMATLLVHTSLASMLAFVRKPRPKEPGRLLRLLLVILLALSCLGGIPTVMWEAFAAPGLTSISDKSWPDVKSQIEAYRGVPYVWGGKSPSGWDCSGFVGWVVEHVYGVPGGGNYYTGSMVTAWSKYTVFSGSSAADYNNAFSAGTIKPGDIILFFNSSGTDVHVAIAGENQAVYHAWYEGFGTGTCRFDYMWGIDGGHGKSYMTFAVYRGLAQEGWIDLQKVSASPTMTDGNNAYSLTGAVYGIYTNPDATTQVGTLTTNADGYAQSESLEPGTYYVKETAPPKGYEADSSIYTVTVTGSTTTRVNTAQVTDIPLGSPLPLLVRKTDSVLGATAQGEAVLAGAEFTVKYYNDYYETAAKAEATGAALRTWVFVTDKNGSAVYDDRYLKAGSDPLYYGPSGDATIPLGTVTIAETKAPWGYLLDDGSGGAPGTYVRKIEQDKDDPNAVVEYNTPENPDLVVRGGVLIQKLDRETALNAPLGRATVDGAKFDIVSLNPNPVVVDGKDYANGQTVKTLETKGGVATTAADTLPFGTYIIKEVTPPDGYLITDMVQEFSIRENGVIVELTGERAIANQAIRGDLAFVKIEAKTMKRLGNVVFEIKSNTTGEAHNVVADENGYYSTASSWNPHSRDTNRGQTGEDGVWFGLAADGSMAAVDDRLGALPYDTYTITELPCEANEGKKLIAFEVVVKRDGVTIDIGTLTDEFNPKIETSARDADSGTKNMIAAGNAAIVDMVSYSRLAPGKTYTLRGILMDKATGKPLLVNGDQVKAETTFTPERRGDDPCYELPSTDPSDKASSTREEPDGAVEVTFIFDASGLGGKELVVFERLYTDEGIEIAAHEDINDAGQTVKAIKPPPGTPFDKTGNTLLDYWWLVAVLLLATVVGMALAIKGHRKATRRRYVSYGNCVVRNDRRA